MWFNNTTTRGLLLEKIMLSTVATGECLVWTGLVDSYGYGRIVIKNKHWKVHRLVYLLNKGDFDTNLYILHKCDNPSCIKIDHLFQGTQSDNMQDAVSKGRIKRGEQAGRAVLTQSQVDYIRSKFDANGKAPYGTIKRLSAELGVAYSTVNFVKRRLSWRG